MRIYTFGDREKAELLLLPGNFIDGQDYYREVIPLLRPYFHVILVSYNGFDGREDTVFRSLPAEADAVQDYLIEHYGGKLFALYGSAIGGTIAALLMKRGKVCFDHVMIGGIDFDRATRGAAFLQSRLFGPMFYRMIHTGVPARMIEKELRGLPPADSYVKQLRMMGVGSGGKSTVKKESVINQFYSEWTTDLGRDIWKQGTQVYFFHAGKTGPKYIAKFRETFRDAQVLEYEGKHEELLLRFPARWAGEVCRLLGKEADFAEEPVRPARSFGAAYDNSAAAEEEI